MKKLIALAIALVMLMTLSGGAMAQGYTAGTYTATYAGNNGPVVVEVAFSADAITDITILEHAETPGISDTAITRIPLIIVEHQSLGVDAISGATNTSKAILSAVADCVMQAGGDLEALMAAPIILEKQEKTVDLNTQLLVVGGGGAGMAATLRAREEGLDVILLEKMAFLGGATSICGGAMIVTGSKLQTEKGVTNDTPETMFADLMVNGHNLNDPEKLKLYSENVGDTADWLVENLGVGFTEKMTIYAEHSVDRVVSFTGSAAGLTKTLRENIAKCGANVMMETRGESLIVEDGAVVGVEATAADGTRYRIYADVVLLTTGGFGNNKDMQTEELRRVLYYGPESSTGDGHLMAEAVGAKMKMMDLGKSYPNGVESAPGIAKSTINANRNALDVSAIEIDLNGNRVCDERGANKDVLAVLLEQPNSTLYYFMDQPSFDAFKTGLANTGINEAMLAQWLEANGAETPIFAHADTVDEVCEIVGINAENLKATIERYNSFVEKGVDEDFGRAANYLKAKISETGPYYLVEQKPRFATTLGGVCVTNDLEVINAADEVIPGLYAAGELVGGVQGDDSPPGSNVGWALTSGRLAGEHIASILK